MKTVEVSALLLGAALVAFPSQSTSAGQTIQVQQYQTPPAPPQAPQIFIMPQQQPPQVIIVPMPHNSPLPPAAPSTQAPIQEAFMCSTILGQCIIENLHQPGQPVPVGAACLCRSNVGAIQGVAE
jgi:hypothetical protein